GRPPSSALALRGGRGRNQRVMRGWQAHAGTSGSWLDPDPARTFLNRMFPGQLVAPGKSPGGGVPRGGGERVKLPLSARLPGGCPTCGACMRTHFCGLVDESLIGQTITLAGWTDVARNLGGVCFIDLRDHEGIVQVTVEPDNAEVFPVAASLGYEDVIQVEGVVRARHAVNDKIRSGKVEVIATRITILNKAAPLPFHAHENPTEETRLRYRYLDLRRPEMQRMQRTRIKLVQALRRHLDAAGFQDIETPILTKATPEGARDFLVPARMHPGEFYALPQSPQLFKQILMVAGFDRYYLIARCFRDEALRADRQLEFTQLDMEFAFVRERDVQDFVEDMIRAIFKEVVDVELDAQFPRMTWAEAMRRYGSDKPDLRIDLELVDVAELVKD